MTEKEQLALLNEVEKILGTEPSAETVTNMPVSEEERELLDDLYTIGKHNVGEGATDFGEWSKQMVDEYGEFVIPHLQPVWDRINPASQSATQQKRGDRTPNAAGSIDSNILAVRALKNENRRLKRRLAYARKKLAAAREPVQAEEEEEAVHAASREGGPDVADGQHGQENVGPMRTVPSWMWDPRENSIEMNLEWCRLRALEWGRWPYFISQPIVPVMLAFWPWQAVIFAVLLCNAMWHVWVVERDFISLPLAQFGAYFVRLKWLACPLMGYVLYSVGLPVNAAIALLWPLLMIVVPSLPIINRLVVGALPTGNFVTIQSQFMTALLAYYAPSVPLSFSVGSYRLGDLIEALPGLVEFSQFEYSIFGRNFEGERNYNASPVEFLGRPWSVKLGSVDGKIYKIAPHLELKTKQELRQTAKEIFQYCKEQLGEPSERKSGMALWHTTEGNVVFQAVEATDQLAVNLFVTSNDVRDFKRI